VIDRRWREHLYEMDYLKDGIGLRAMAQRDPLVEYQREGFALFQQMMGQIREESVGFLFNLDVEVTAGTGTSSVPTVAAKGLGMGDAEGDRFSYSAPSDSGGVEVRNQRGQIEQTATTRAQRRLQEPESLPSVENQRAREGARAAGDRKGAFGQVDAAQPDSQPPAINRQQRRNQERRKR